MRPSSIFSSETLRLGGYRPWGLALTLVFALLFEIGLARRAAFWTLIPNSPTGLIAVQDEIASRMESPKVLILGNSRMIDAVLPEQLDRELGLPRQSSFNLSIQAGRPFDFLSFYDRNRDRLDGLRLLIVGLDDNLFGQLMDSAEQRFRLLATLDQRSAYAGTQRLSFLAGGLLRSLDVGQPAWSMLRARLAGRGEISLHDDSRIAWTEQRQNGPAAIPQITIDRIVNRNYTRYEFSPAQLAFLEELIELCRRDGVQVLLVRPPARDAFIDRALELEPEKVAAAGSVYSRLRPAPLLFGRASELDLGPEEFLDYGHFSLSGGAAFTGVVADSARDLLAAGSL